LRWILTTLALSCPPPAPHLLACISLHLASWFPFVGRRRRAGDRSRAESADLYTPMIDLDFDTDEHDNQGQL
jgi:hypothetical protein